MTEFGIPFWDPPKVTQGGKALDSAKHVTYLHGAAPGMPFPYGETVVTVKAVGEITGNRTREEDQMDECTFRVTVKDPFRPYVDGRHFRCGAESAGKTEPFGVCEGSDLKVQMHEGYQETGGYDLVEGLTRTEGSCCDDEKGQSYTCSPSPSSLFKYCKPGSMADPAEGRWPRPCRRRRRCRRGAARTTRSGTRTTTSGSRRASRRWTTRTSPRTSRSRRPPRSRPRSRRRPLRRRRRSPLTRPRSPRRRTRRRGPRWRPTMRPMRRRPLRRRRRVPSRRLRRRRSP